MMRYNIGYINESKFKRIEKGLRKYNITAYKKLFFDVYPALNEGNLLGEVVDEKLGIIHYELKLPSDIEFSKIHGDVKLYYLANKKEKSIKLDTITPEDILSENNKNDSFIYKGVAISKDDSH